MNKSCVCIKCVFSKVIVSTLLSIVGLRPTSCCRIRIFRFIYLLPFMGAAAAKFICHEKNIHVYINVKDRRAARKE